MTTAFRRIMALVAAYAIALQALLAAFAPMAHAGTLAAICRTDGAGAPATVPPASGHDPSCLACAAGGCSHGAAGCARASDPIAWPAAIGTTTAARYSFLPRPQATLDGPQLPRAPPGA